MSKSYVFIRELSDHNLTWTIKIKVIRESQTCQSKDGKTTYKKLTLMGEKDTTIQASIFGKDIEAFKDTLKLENSYYISRGYLEKIRPEFKSSAEEEHDYQMTIKKFTKVEEAGDCDVETPSKNLHILPLRDLSSVSVGQQHIDIVAIVLNVSQVEKRKRRRDSTDVSLREIRLIDASLQPTVLSAWGRFVENECETICQLLASRPIIIATNLHIKDVYGRKILSTSSSTDILINADRPEVKELEAWKLNFKSELDNLSTDTVPIPSMDRLVNIKHIINSGNTNETYCTKASIITILPQEKCWYMACNNCRRKTIEAHRTTFACQGCETENAIAEPWFCVRVELGDDSGSIHATIFGTDAEKVLSCKVETIMDLSLEEHFDQLEKWMATCGQTEYIFCVKLVKRKNNDQLSVVAITDLA